MPNVTSKQAFNLIYDFQKLFRNNFKTFKDFKPYLRNKGFLELNLQKQGFEFSKDATFGSEGFLKVGTFVPNDVLSTMVCSCLNWIV